MRGVRAVTAVRRIWLLISATRPSARRQTDWAASPSCAELCVVSSSSGIYQPSLPGSLPWLAFKALRADEQLAHRWVPQPPTRPRWHTRRCRRSAGHWSVR
jgi:hypothetical protein